MGRHWFAMDELKVGTEPEHYYFRSNSTSHLSQLGQKQSNKIQTY